MVQLYAFRRSLVALALCSAAIVASATPASARSHHGAGRHAHARHVSRHAGRHYAYRQHSAIIGTSRASRWDAGVAQMQARGFAGTNASLASSSSPGGMATSGGFGSSNVVAEARRYIGGNPTSRGSLWCARFMNMVLAAFRLSRHRLGHGAFVRKLRPARIRTAGRRHRGDGTARRRPCRRGQRHRRREAIRSWSQATTATGSGKRRFRAAGFTPTSCRRADASRPLPATAPRRRGEACAKPAPHSPPQSLRRRSPRHRSRNRRGRSGASACSGCRGRARRYRDRR